MISEIVVKNGKVLHLGLAKGQLAENVFLVGDPARAIRVSKRFESILCEVRNREYVTITGRFNGMPVSVIGTGIGVDNVEILVLGKLHGEGGIAVNLIVKIVAVIRFELKC